MFGPWRELVANGMHGSCTIDGCSHLGVHYLWATERCRIKFHLLWVRAFFFLSFFFVLMGKHGLRDLFVTLCKDYTFRTWMPFEL